MKDIDEIDGRILNYLQKDGRISNAELSEKVQLSASATAERTKRLQKDGIIQDYFAKLDPNKLEKSLLMFVEIKLEHANAKIFEKFQIAVNNISEIMECHMLVGNYDYLIKIRTKDMNAYRAFLSDKLLTLPGISDTNTYPVIEEVKNTHIISIG